MKREEPITESLALWARELWGLGHPLGCLPGARVLLIEASPRVGVRPVRHLAATLEVSSESGCLGMQPKVGGKLHLRLNTDTSPIADKYREGKLKRTLKREFKST